MEDTNINILVMTVLKPFNYHVQKCKMEVLRCFGWKPEGKSDAEWKIIHRKVCSYIHQWIDRIIVNHATAETEAKSCEKTLRIFMPRKPETIICILLEN